MPEKKSFVGKVLGELLPKGAIFVSYQNEQGRTWTVVAGNNANADFLIPEGKGKLFVRAKDGLKETEVE